MKRILIVIILSLAYSFPVFAEGNLIKAGSDYQIAIPSDWIEIPKDKVDQFAKVASEAAGQNQTFDYGYQSNEYESWFSYPYVLIKVERSGRIPEGQLKKYEKVESGLQDGFKEVVEASNFLSNMSLGETLYDPSIHTLWSTLSMDVAGRGTIRLLIAVKLTEYGSIQFMGYDLEHQFNEIEPIYRGMVHSIKLEEKDVYKPRITDDAPTLFGINLGQTAIWAIIGGLIGGLLSLFKKFNKKNS